jgi:hypothetical protein
MRPSCSFYSPLHTNVPDLTKVMLPVLLATKLQSGAPEMGRMVPTDDNGSFCPSSFAGNGGVVGPLYGGEGGAMGC